MDDADDRLTTDRSWLNSGSATLKNPLIIPLLMLFLASGMTAMVLVAFTRHPATSDSYQPAIGEAMMKTERSSHAIPSWAANLTDETVDPYAALALRLARLNPWASVPVGQHGLWPILRCDNFFDYACGGWLKSVEMPPDKTRYMYSFDQADDRVADLMHKALQHDEGMAGQLFRSCCDVDTINALKAQSSVGLTVPCPVRCDGHCVVAAQRPYRDLMVRHAAGEQSVIIKRSSQ